MTTKRLPRITGLATLATWLNVLVTETDDEATIAASCIQRLDELDERAWRSEGMASFAAQKGAE